MLAGVFWRMWSAPDLERAPDPPAAYRLDELQVPTLRLNATEDVHGYKRLPISWRTTWRDSSRATSPALVTSRP
jgi:hypothetical protein